MCWINFNGEINEKKKRCWIACYEQKQWISLRPFDWWYCRIVKQRNNPLQLSIWELVISVVFSSLWHAFCVSESHWVAYLFGYSLSTVEAQEEDQVDSCWLLDCHHWSWLCCWLWNFGFVVFCFEILKSVCCTVFVACIWNCCVLFHGLSFIGLSPYLVT